MIRAVGVGDNVCDKYRNINKMFPGGQTLNFSVYCRQQGNYAGYIGVIGNDAVANHVLHCLREIGIDISRIRQCPGENGYAVIELHDGERNFIYSNKGGILREKPLILSEDDLSYIASFDIIHTSNNSYIDHELFKLSRIPNWLSYDFSNAWINEKKTKLICKYIDFAFLSCSDLPIDKVKEQLMKLHLWGCSMCIATLGSDGSIVYDGQKFFSHKPKKVKAIDTLGAGDSLAAGFLINFVEHYRYGRLEKGTDSYDSIIYDSLQVGADLAARTCMIQGAFGYGINLV